MENFRHAPRPFPTPATTAYFPTHARSCNAVSRSRALSLGSRGLRALLTVLTALAKLQGSQVTAPTGRPCFGRFASRAPATSHQSATQPPGGLANLHQGREEEKARDWTWEDTAFARRRTIHPLEDPRASRSRWVAAMRCFREDEKVRAALNWRLLRQRVRTKPLRVIRRANRLDWKMGASLAVEQSIKTESRRWEGGAIPDFDAPEGVNNSHWQNLSGQFLRWCGNNILCRSPTVS